MVKSIVLDQPYQGKNEIATDGVFVEIGGVPNTAFFKELGLKTTDEGNIEVDPFQQTNIPGVFAAGDITNGSGGLRQIVTACSEGAVAATSAYKFIKEGKVEHEN